MAKGSGGTRNTATNKYDVDMSFPKNDTDFDVKLSKMIEVAESYGRDNGYNAVGRGISKHTYSDPNVESIGVYASIHNGMIMYEATVEVRAKVQWAENWKDIQNSVGYEDKYYRTLNEAVKEVERQRKALNEADIITNTTYAITGGRIKRGRGGRKLRGNN